MNDRPVCPLCGHANSEKCFSERNHDLLVCSNCDLFFIHPYTRDTYNKVSTYNYKNLKILDSTKHYNASRKYFISKYLAYIQKECEGANSLLDVGCGTGALLQLLHEIRPDLRLAGVELNIERAQFAQKIANCPIYQAPIEELSINERFDIITMINVLSHISSFDRLFVSLHKLMTNNGKIILKVSEMTKNVRKDAMFDWGIPDHLHFLGMNTIKFVCDKYNFRIVRHIRQPLAVDLFARWRWLLPGRSRIRNAVKYTVALTPLALTVLRKNYERKHKDTIYSSFIVIAPI